MFGDNFFKKVEKKTNINKETILSLADKLQKSDMKDENTLREVIKDISVMTGKEVSKGVQEESGGSRSLRKGLLRRKKIRRC